MNIRFKLVSFVGMAFLFLSHYSILNAQTSVSADQFKEGDYWLQDRARFAEGSAFKGISKFNFYTMIPAPTPAFAQKMDDLFSKELAKVGTVKKTQFIIDTDEGVMFDPIVSGGEILIYEIKNVSSINQKKPNIVRASLNMESYVTMEQTKESFCAYVWSANCFLEGDTETDLENLVSNSLSYLLKVFETSYSADNKEKPTFNLVTH